MKLDRINDPYQWHLINPLLSGIVKHCHQTNNSKLKCRSPCERDEETSIPITLKGEGNHCILGTNI
jgi:hypothetical protein